MTTNKLRTYSELKKLKTFEERFEYLKLDGVVGEETFGFDRYLNQKFYKSKEWRDIRNYVIARDMGCDLGIPDREIIADQILIHHMNPITKEDIINHSELLLDPEYLVCTIFITHKALHFGDISLLPEPYVERQRNDTCPWKH